MLPDAIEALLDNNHQVLVWDHGSTDETPDILRRYRNELLECTRLPREFDFYELYPTMSRYLIENYVTRYDWISWPDQDGILEGPDRSKRYCDFIRDVLASDATYVRFENFNFWFTTEDDSTITSPPDKIRRYALFPDCAPRIRAWKAAVTNERWFNHNPLTGNEYPRAFRLRHYPMRHYER